MANGGVANSCSLFAFGLRALLFPSRKCGGEDAVAGDAFLDRQDGAPAVIEDDRHVEPRALLEQLDIVLLFRIDRREPYEEIGVSDLDGVSGERNAELVL